MRLKKQSMRQIKDAAAHERAVTIVENIGSIALAEAAKRADSSREQPRYFRGALIKPR